MMAPVMGSVCNNVSTTTPEGSGIGRHEETDGEKLDAVLLYRTDEVAAVFLHGIGALFLYIEHLGHRRSEDVGIQKSYLVAETCQGDGEIGRDCALADATLARADGDDVLDTRQQLAYFRTGSRLELCLDGHIDVLTTVVLDGCFGSLDCGFQKRVGVAWEHEHNLHFPVVSFLRRSGYRRGVGNHLALYEVFLRAGIHHRCQRIHYQLWIEGH